VDVEGLEPEDDVVEVGGYSNALVIDPDLHVVPDARSPRFRVRPGSETVVPLQVSSASHAEIAVEADLAAPGGSVEARHTLIAEATGDRVQHFAPTPGGGRPAAAFQPCLDRAFRLVGRIERTVLPAAPDWVMVYIPAMVPTGRGMLVDSIVHLPPTSNDEPIVVTASLGATIESCLRHVVKLPSNSEVHVVRIDPLWASFRSMYAESVVERASEVPGVGTFLVTGFLPNATYAVGRRGTRIITGSEGSVTQVELGVECTRTNGE
jgi:hypothetical protein